MKAIEKNIQSKTYQKIQVTYFYIIRAIRCVTWLQLLPKNGINGIDTVNEEIKYGII